jgi:hypothetical protein
VVAADDLLGCSDLDRELHELITIATSTSSCGSS